MGYYDRYSRGPRRGRGAVSEQPPRRTGVLGMLFNPQLGMSLRPLRETGRMFVHMVALIFAQANLIDPRHPAVTGQGGQRFGLFDVVMLAHQRVEWRQENFAQCALFSAVVASIVICALAMVYALFTLVFHIA